MSMHRSFRCVENVGVKLNKLDELKKYNVCKNLMYAFEWFKVTDIHTHTRNAQLHLCSNIELFNCCSQLVFLSVRKQRTGTRLNRIDSTKFRINFSKANYLKSV